MHLMHAHTHPPTHAGLEPLRRRAFYTVGLNEDLNKMIESADTGVYVRVRVSVCVCECVCECACVRVCGWMVGSRRVCAGGWV